MRHIPKQVVYLSALLFCVKLAACGSPLRNSSIDPSLPQNKKLFDADAPETKSEEVTLRISAEKQACDAGWGFTSCFIADGQLLYEGIHGWNFEWGFVTDLVVKIETFSNAAEDAPSRRIELVEVIERSAVAAGTQFTFKVPQKIFTGDSFIQDGQSTKYSLLGEKDFACIDVAICDEIQRALTADDCMNLKMKHEGIDKPLSAISVEACTDKNAE